MQTWLGRVVMMAALALAPVTLAQDEHDAGAERDFSIPVRTGEGSVELERDELEYAWSVGTLPVLDDETGAVRAEIFHIAYRVEPEDEDEPRPVTFVFNGGPGSSSVWLHMGALGPRRIAFANEKGDPTPPPYRVIDNAHTWLAFTDLVFIDPVSTGFSRPADGVDKNEFHGVDEDVASVGDFIQLWTSRNGAWDAPKYLCGESYGSTRAAGLAEYLQDRHAMYLSGVVMVSAAIDFGTLRFAPGNVVPYPLYLPSFAATAHYHGALDDELKARELDDFVEEVERFAIEAYTPALMLGDRLEGPRRDRIVRTLARFTGTDEGFIARNALTPTIWRFTQELLRDENRKVGRLDSRFASVSHDAGSDSPDADPSYDVILGPYASAVNQHLREELGVEDDRVYEILTGKVRPWNFGDSGQGYTNVAPNLASAMRQNPHLRVYFQSGLYDLATPYFATDFVIAQMRLDPSLRPNVTHTVYPSGHMMYLHYPTLVQQTRDTRAWYEAAPAAEAYEGGE
jgi:carboxypeptidase C (cathepsin A)